MSARRPDPAASPARGAILVAVAVVIGFVLLRNGLDTSEVVASGNDRSDRTTSSVQSTTSTSAARSPAEITVLVANGSGVDGAASTMSTTLESKGYNAAEPTNAERVPSTKIYFVAGFEREAAGVAKAIGAPAASVAAMPTPAPVANLGGANVLVVLGPDLAPK